VASICADSVAGHAKVHNTLKGMTPRPTHAFPIRPRLPRAGSARPPSLIDATHRRSARAAVMQDKRVTKTSRRKGARMRREPRITRLNINSNAPAFQIREISVIRG